MRDRLRQWWSSRRGRPEPAVGELPANARTARRQLLVDVSRIARQDAGTGIQRVVRGALAGLAKVAGETWDVRPVFATSRLSYRYAPDNFLSDVSLSDGPPVVVAPGDVFLGLDLSTRFICRYAPQLAEWKARGAKVSIVVYDLLPAAYPQWFNRRTSRHFRRWLWVVRRLSDSVLCISEDVAGELERFWQDQPWWRRRGPDPTVRLFRLGWDIEGSLPSPGNLESESEVLRWAAEAPTVLMVGTLEPRKGHAEALAAFERLWREDGDSAPRLLIVGRPGWKTRPLQKALEQHPMLGRKLYWSSSASDALLIDLYRRCAGVLVASRAEGFGLPVAEALNNARPVLVRNLPVFRMFAGPGLTTFDRDDPEHLSAAIARWLADVATASPRITRAWSMTWEAAARHLLDTLDGIGTSDASE